MKSNVQSILFICMGNICRSPAAHAVMQQLNRERQLGWRIDSCGTDAYHQGVGPDSRMQKTLRQHGYLDFQHAAQLFRLSMAHEFDLLLAMDFRNYEEIYKQLLGDQESGPLIQKLHLFRDFDPLIIEMGPDQRAEVPDPYYNGTKSFEEVYQMIVRTCENLADKFSQ